tara:strand:+ start:642 stop:956 length:315 start_codon:yes stop_codon:yes gene_type:complete
MNKRKLEKVIRLLKSHVQDSRVYLDTFYTECKNDEIEDMDWVQSDREFHDFLNSQPLEYNRIWDLAVLKTAEKLLEVLDVEVLYEEYKMNDDDENIRTRIEFKQ